jgi:DNA-binding response OmpR family regulator
MVKAPILVVDDNPAILRILKRTLELEGYDVVTAAGGVEAIDAAQKQAPCLVLLDVMMPGVDGYRVLETIRKKSQVPVLMLSALDNFSSREKAVELGADGYIAKPFNRSELLARIRALLKKGRVKTAQRLA